MTIKELCAKHNTTQTKLSRRFNIPLRTVQNWYAETREVAPYIVDMMDWILTYEPVVDQVMEVAKDLRSNSI